MTPTEIAVFITATVLMVSGFVALATG